MKNEIAVFAALPIDLNDDERWQLALRITSSVQFAKATQLRNILLYVTRCCLQEETSMIRESEIACRVLGRRGTFNPTDDNIVRVQMSHLRKKLELYFDEEGSGEALELSIPKGSYVPRFEPRIPKLQLAELISAVDEPVHDCIVDFPSAVKETLTAPGKADVRITYLVAAAALVLVSVLIFYLGRFSQHPEGAKAATRLGSENALLQKIFITDLPVNVVVADTNLVMLQNVLRTDISIRDYTSKDYPSNIISNTTGPEVHALLSGLARRRFTSLADVNVVKRCAEIGDGFGTKITVHYPLFMNARDFEQGNFILIGSRTGDPWVALFEPQLNFAFERNPDTQVFHFRNKHPLPNEQAEYIPNYIPDSRFNASTTSYVDIALVPNLSKTGYVLLLNAITMDANEAAAKLIFGDQLPAGVAQLLVSEPGRGTGNHSFEILLRDRAIDGMVISYEVVATRKFS